jgi:hypothetical protein
MSRVPTGTRDSELGPARHYASAGARTQNSGPVPGVTRYLVGPAAEQTPRMGASITGLRMACRCYRRRGYLHRGKGTTAVAAPAGAVVLVHGWCSRSCWIVTRWGCPSRAHASPMGSVLGGEDRRLMLAHRERPCTFPSEPERHKLSNTLHTIGDRQRAICERKKSQPQRKCAVEYSPHAPSFRPLQDGHTLVYIFHFPYRICHATRALCAPYAQ